MDVVLVSLLLTWNRFHPFVSWTNKCWLGYHFVLMFPFHVNISIHFNAFHNSTADATEYWKALNRDIGTKKLRLYSFTHRVLTPSLRIFTEIGAQILNP